MIAISAKRRGFTLIELMIAVVIVGLLAAIALPSYQAHVVRSNRAAAAACLTEMAQFMERNYTQNMRYNPAGFVLPDFQCATDLNARYQFSSVAADLGQRTYTLQAVPTTLHTDARCQTLTLNQAGQKGAAGGFDANTVRNCW